MSKLNHHQEFLAMSANESESHMSTSPSRLQVPSGSRWFYSVASLSLLVVMFVGFQLFYLQWKSFPGRPITPPIRMLIIVHAFLMTAWMLLAVVQPLLVGMRHQRLHMKLGVLGVGLAVGILIAGVWVGTEAARVAPPGLRFGLDPKQFMAVQVLSILLFALFVAVGVANRRRTTVHRPMMLMASVSVIGAAFGRMIPLNGLYAGTVWEVVFTTFFMQLIFAAVLVAANCLVFRSFDRWLIGGFAAMAVVSVAISLGAKTHALDQFATFLLR
jgi:hypothetical protein